MTDVERSAVPESAVERSAVPESDVMSPNVINPDIAQPDDATAAAAKPALRMVGSTAGAVCVDEFCALPEPARAPNDD